jgi:hypothetical protein
MKAELSFVVDVKKVIFLTQLFILILSRSTMVSNQKAQIQLQCIQDVEEVVQEKNVK